ncbi:RAxF-45 family protein [Shouchella lehensis]
MSRLNSFNGSQAKRLAYLWICQAIFSVVVKNWISLSVFKQLYRKINH